jgi:shikimate dehydrogenase
MREFGLIGYPLGHSYSRNYFSDKFRTLGIDSDNKYRLFPISEISKIKNILASHQNLAGLNVTTPYKELIIPYLNELDTIALKLGNVNTVKIIRNGKSTHLKGYNTDIYGFTKTLNLFDIEKTNKKAIILGSGGSAKTVSFVLNSQKIEFTHISRNPSTPNLKGYWDLSASLIENHHIIINATPVGMHPFKEKCPNVPYENISDQHMVIDLVYNPEKTLFLEKCEQQGAKIANGLTMLYEQAEKAWEIWNE